MADEEQLRILRQGVEIWNPLLAGSSAEYGMFEHLERFPWVLAIHRYRDLDDLLASLQDQVIAPAEAKAKELTAT